MSRGAKSLSFYRAAASFPCPAGATWGSMAQASPHAHQTGQESGKANCPPNWENRDDDVPMALCRDRVGSGMDQPGFGLTNPSRCPLTSSTSCTSGSSSQAGESRWMEIDWHPSVWEGRQKAAQGKPLFIWAGAASAGGRLLNSGTLGPRPLNGPTNRSSSSRRTSSRRCADRSQPCQRTEGEFCVGPASTALGHLQRIHELRIAQRQVVGTCAFRQSA